MKTFFGKKSRNTLTFVIIVSLALHVVALVIFGAVKLADSIFEREEKVLKAAPIEAPPEIPEDRVEIQPQEKSAPPPSPPTIVVNRVSDLEVPKLDIDVDIESSSVFYSGNVGGLGDSITSIRDSILEIDSLIGYDQYLEGTLEATLIDLKRDRSGKPSKVNRLLAIREFTDSSWNLNNLTRKFYSAKKKLYMSFWMIENGPANRAPAAFDVEGEIEPSGIAALYQGAFTPSKDMRMRFCGMADDVLVVRLNKKTILDASWQKGYSDLDFNEAGPRIPSIPKPIRNGEWIDLKADETYDLSILVAEIPGGSFCCYLFYQIEGQDRLRIFSTKPFTTAEKKAIRELHPAIAEML